MKRATFTLIALSLLYGVCLLDGPTAVAWHDDVGVAHDHEHVHEPVAVPDAEAHRPSAIPDRILLSWTGDPATTQTVTWRTDDTVSVAYAEIAVATDGPEFDDAPQRFAAATESLESNSGRRTITHTRLPNCSRPRSTPIASETASTGASGFTSPPPAPSRPRLHSSTSVTPRTM